MTKSTMSIREQLFADVKPGRSETIELSNGVKVEVRQPTRGVRNRILQESCETVGKETKFNAMAFADRCVIQCTFNAETGNRVFKDSDYDEIEKLQNAEWFDELVEVVQRIISVTQKDMEKN